MAAGLAAVLCGCTSMRTAADGAQDGSPESAEAGPPEPADAGTQIAEGG